MDAIVDGLKALDPNRPIREADIGGRADPVSGALQYSGPSAALRYLSRAVSKAEPLGHHPDHVGKQSVAHSAGLLLLMRSNALALRT
jgi:hypothetical protein